MLVVRDSSVLLALYFLHLVKYFTVLLGPLDKMKWTADGQLLAVSTVKGIKIFVCLLKIHQTLLVMFSLSYF